MSDIPVDGLHHVSVHAYRSWDLPSYSTIKLLADHSPADAAAMGWLRGAPSRAMAMGSAVDMGWTHGIHTMCSHYLTAPLRPPPKRNGEPYSDWPSSKPGKAWAKAWESCGGTVLSHSDACHVMGMLHALESHELASTLRDESTLQVAAVWHDNETGVRLKALFDGVVAVGRMLPCRGIIWDLKTTTDPTERGFLAQSKKYCYGWQAWLYQSALKTLTGCDYDWLWTVVGSQPMHAVRVYRPPDDAIESAGDAVLTALQHYADHALTGKWTSSQDTVPIELDWPRYQHGR